MEHTTYIVDGPTLVENIHFLKKAVYNGLIQIHIPTCATETAEKLYQKSLEPKEMPKNDKPKRWSGRIRREQQPLFDINPRTTMEFLNRAQTDGGIAGVTFQSENEEFTQWREENDKADKTEEKPPAPPNSFSEALLRKLNIKEVDDKTDDVSGKPKLVAKASNGKTSTFKYQKVPSISVKDIPKNLQSLLSCALWRVHECEGNPLKPSAYELLTDDQKTVGQASILGLPVCSGRKLKAQTLTRQAAADRRQEEGELEQEFPDVPRRETPCVRKPSNAQPSASLNGEAVTSDEAERALEAVALSVVQGLEQPDGMDVKYEQQMAKVIAAELRPSISYAMAAGSVSSTPTKPASLSPQPPPAETPQTPVLHSRAVEVAQSPIPELPHVAEKLTEQTASPNGDDEIDSDEEVVVFNPRARQAAQASKKRRSREVSSPIIQSVSRPTTANGPAAQQPNSPRPSSSVLNSVLKPDSPVFSPRQMFIASSPTMKTSSLSSPTIVATGEALLSPQGLAPPQRASTTSPQAQAKQPPNGPRQSRGNSQGRQTGGQDASQRQSEMILQRQREAIKRSTQLQNEAKAGRSQKEGGGNSSSSTKAPPREVDLRPTNNPVVIDPDDFGRDYTIKPGAQHEAASPRPKGEGRSRRGGGKGRANKQPTEGARGSEVDFVLKSGNPRGATRGRGKLWVP